MIGIVIGLIVALVLFYACAYTFYEIACMKGHGERKYFWWTFFIPLMGALMVIALPDRGAIENLHTSEDFPVLKLSNEESPFHVSVGPPSIPPIADVPKDDKPVTPVVVAPYSTDTEAQIECPACGRVQRANRTVCWECGAKFNKN